MQVSTLILMTWNSAQGKRLWACSRNFVRRAMLIVQNAIQTVQLRAVKSAWEIKAHEATCGGGTPVNRRFMHQCKCRGL